MDESGSAVVIPVKILIFSNECNIGIEMTRSLQCKTNKPSTVVYTFEINFLLSVWFCRYIDEYFNPSHLISSYYSSSSMRLNRFGGRSTSEIMRRNWNISNKYFEIHSDWRITANYLFSCSTFDWFMCSCGYGLCSYQITCITHPKYSIEETKSQRIAIGWRLKCDN